MIPSFIYTSTPLQTAAEGMNSLIYALGAFAVSSPVTLGVMLVVVAVQITTEVLEATIYQCVRSPGPLCYAL